MSRKTKTTATKADGKPALVPKLRFPEFQNAVEWENKPLSTCLDYQQPTPYLVSGTNYSPAFKTPVLTAGKTFILGYTDEEHGIFSEDLPVIIFDDFTTATQFVDFPFKAKSSAMKILQAKNGANIKFMFETLQTLAYEVGAHERHWISNFAPMLVAVPKPPEQQKIAACLSSVDELLAAQARQVAALQTHKKGLMQQLFPRAGETQPRLRFPEFHNAGEWVQKTVGDVSEVLMCKRIFAEETNPTEGVPFYKIGTLGGVPDAFISREQFEDYKTRYNFPRKGEVLITCSGTVGKCLSYDGNDAYFQDSNIVWLDNPKGEVSNEFLLMLLSNVNWGRLNSTTITRIYGPDLRGVMIKFPEDEDEQQRIAACLSSLDDLITAATQKLAALQTHKRGLMQQLFPSPPEVVA